MCGILLLYYPRCDNKQMFIQSNLFRNLYNTEQLIDNMLKDDYISDKEILENRSIDTFNFESLKKIKRNKRK